MKGENEDDLGENEDKVLSEMEMESRGRWRVHRRRRDFGKQSSCNCYQTSSIRSCCKINY
jgi:hypothetical protein